MEVTRFSLNSNLGLSSSRQIQIRSAIHHFEQAFLKGEISSSIKALCAHILGQVHLFTKFLPKLKQSLL